MRPLLVSGGVTEGRDYQATLAGILPNGRQPAVDDSRDPNTVHACKRRPVTQLMRDGVGTGGGGGDHGGGFQILSLSNPHHAAPSSRPAQPEARAVFVGDAVEGRSCQETHSSARSSPESARPRRSWPRNYFERFPKERYHAEVESSRHLQSQNIELEAAARADSRAASRSRAIRERQMKFREDRPFAGVDAAVKKLMEIANGREPDHAGRIHIGPINKLFMDAGGSPLEYSAVKAAIDRSYMTMHPSGGYLSFTQAAADLFA